MVSSEPRSSWSVLAIAVAAMILLPAALTGTTIAFPEIEQSFGSSRATLSWILSGYSITTAAFTLLGGQLSDRLGPRTMFIRGMCFFLIGAVACTFAPNVGILISGRTLQGIGAALFAPASLAKRRHQWPTEWAILLRGQRSPLVQIGQSQDFVDLDHISFCQDIFLFKRLNLPAFLGALEC